MYPSPRFSPMVTDHAAPRIPRPPVGEPYRVVAHRCPDPDCERGYTLGRGAGELVRSASWYSPAEYAPVYVTCPSCFGSEHVERRMGYFDGQWHVVERPASGLALTGEARCWAFDHRDEALLFAERCSVEDLCQWEATELDVELLASVGLVWVGGGR